MNHEARIMRQEFEIVSLNSYHMPLLPKGAIDG